MDGAGRRERKTGLPAKPWGRVEVAVAPSDGSVVYAVVESAESALYVSGDGGRTWEARDRSQNMVWRLFYFARLVVDPTNADRLFKPDLGLGVSEDGGAAFGERRRRARRLARPLDRSEEPEVRDRRGRRRVLDLPRRRQPVVEVDNLPISQFYHVSVDDNDPYSVYGGLQDNSSWVGTSSIPGGITNSQWENVYGGDGFWVVVDPTDPDAVYAEAQGGYIGSIDRRTRMARDIQPKAGYKEKLRFNWNTPIHASPTRRGRSTSARSSSSARATAARRGSASPRT